MLLEKKIKTNTFISIFLFCTIFATSNYQSKFQNKVKKESLPLNTEICDCNCFQAFLYEGEINVKKIINCYKNEIENFKTLK